MEEETKAEGKKYLFCWDDVPESGSERLRRALRDKFDIGWAKNADICKSDDRKAICVFKDGDSAIIKLNEEKGKAILTTSDGRTYVLKGEEKNDKLCFIDEKKKSVYVLISVKPKYTEEFCIMMVACKGLCDRVFKSKKLAEIKEGLFVLGPYDFLLTLSGKDEEEINKTIFKIRETLGSYINETCTLTKFGILDKEEDKEEYRNKLRNPDEKERKKLFNKFEKELKELKELKESKLLEEGELKSTLKVFKRFNDEKEKETKGKKEAAKVSFLMKIKTKYIEEFYIMMVIFKYLWNNASEHQNLAEIHRFFPVFGHYDFLWEISASGESEEKRDDKINKIIFMIRKLFDECITETVTLPKLKIPMTKEELEKHFDKILGEKSLAKLPDTRSEKVPEKLSEKVPDENYNSEEEIDLKEIYDAETTALKNLLKKAKTFLEPEDLKKRIDELEKQFKELKEKRS